VSLLQVKVPLLIFRVSKILLKRLNLRKQAFDAIIYRLYFFLANDVCAVCFLSERALWGAHHSTCLAQHPIP